MFKIGDKQLAKKNPNNGAILAICIVFILILLSFDIVLGITAIITILLIKFFTWIYDNSNESSVIHPTSNFKSLTQFENAKNISSYRKNNYKKYETIQDFLYDSFAIDKYKLDIDVVDGDGYVNIYYFKKECLAFYILNEYTNNADYKEITKNIFDDDLNTVNYHVKYKVDRLADIVFCHWILDTRKGNCFENGLYGQKKIRNDYFAGNAIYGIPALDYFKGLEGDFSDLNAKSQRFMKKEQRENYKEYVREIYNKLGLEVNYDSYPISFTSKLISADIFLNKFDKYIWQFSIKFDYYTKNIYYGNQIFLMNIENIKNDIKKHLIESGIYSTKWKSELELYQLILKHYKNAIYQYHSATLGLQSFDIFIPDLNIAIEYQGLQHYEPVDIFDGEEGLKKRKELDNKKRRICKNNNILLIEWKYSTPINELNLKKIFRDNGIDIL